ncbi:hypothetical protein AAG906_013355 [Vitis piasezkii]
MKSAKCFTNSRPFQLLLLAFMTVIFLVFPVPLWASDVRYTECGRPVQCGSIQNIFKIECQDEVPVIQIMSESFRVLKINHDNHILRITRLDLYNGTCPSRFLNTTMNYLFSYSPHFGNLTLFFGCSSASPALASNKFSCRRNNTSSIETGYFTIGSIPTDGNLGNCNVSITVPVLPSAVSALINNSASLEQVLNDGFEVLWIIDDTACSECMGSGGRCGYNTSHFQPICFALINLIYCGVQPYRAQLYKVHMPFLRNFMNQKPDVGTLILIGQGGYGTVYKGNLPDGHLVAVKILSEPKGNGEEFINEVASISRTSHVNIVTLLGFCFEGHKELSSMSSCPMDHSRKYLHSGCNTRILHLDIKPQNILLDQDFTQRYATLCKRNSGYVAPEVFSRNFGVVSHKSDVYSFGMMILEMVAGRKIIDTGVSCSSEIYFPHWIYKHLELEDDHLKLQQIFSEGGEPVARKMIFVGLWCIQTNPANRPSIHKAVDMLEGSHEDLQIPPKPFPSSPVRTPPGTPTTSSTNLFQSSDEYTSTITLA